MEYGQMLRISHRGGPTLQYSIPAGGPEPSGDNTPMYATKILPLIICAAIALALQFPPASAAEPVHTRLFENDGKTFYRTPALVISTKGTLIAMASVCDGPPTKESTHAGIVARRSVDGGKKWGPVQTVLVGKDQRTQAGPGIVDPSTGDIVDRTGVGSAVPAAVDEQDGQTGPGQ